MGVGPRAPSGVSGGGPQGSRLRNVLFSVRPCGGQHSIDGLIVTPAALSKKDA